MKDTFGEDMSKLTTHELDDMFIIESKLFVSLLRSGSYTFFELEKVKSKIKVVLAILEERRSAKKKN